MYETEKNKAQVESLFTYYPPQKDQGDRYNEITAKIEETAHLINSLCPDSPEKTLAMRDLQRARMYANASIAVNEPRI